MKKSLLFLSLFLVAVLGVYFNSAAKAAVEINATDKTSFNNAMFADVENGHKNFDAIYFLYNSGVIEGYENDKIREYKPDKQINRVEFLKLIMEGTENAPVKSYEPCFPDISNDAWYLNYVCEAKSEGVIKGYPDGTFKPDKPINEVEAVKILAELLDWQLPKTTEKAQWYEPYIALANDRGIIPEKNISTVMDRGDIAEMIFRNTQVEEFNVKTFEEDLVDELFYEYEIPYGGVLGPEGLLGPGGHFGAEGAFAENGAFAKDGKFTLLGDDFFENKYCYFSDSGGLYERMLEVLEEVSGRSISDLELKGLNTTEFGVMNCYNGVAATDLTLFSKDLTEGYDFQCWETGLPSAKNSGYEEILCYARPQEVDWLDSSGYCSVEESEDEVCEVCYDSFGAQTPSDKICKSIDDYFKKDEICKIEEHADGNSCEVCYDSQYPEVIVWDGCKSYYDDPYLKNKDLNLHIDTGNDVVVAGNKVSFDISVTGKKGDGLSGRKLSLSSFTGRDETSHLKVKDEGDGLYSAEFSSTLAGDYSFELTDTETGDNTNIFLTVKPSTFDHVDVVEVTEPYQDGLINKAKLKVTANDKYGNLIVSPANFSLGAKATFGSTEVTYGDDGFYDVILTAEDYGVSELTLTNKDVSLGVSESFDFFPIQIDPPKGIDSKAKFIEVPVYVWMPASRGVLGSYKFDLNFDSKMLEFGSFKDTDPNDNFPAPIIEKGSGKVSLSQTNSEVSSPNPEFTKSTPEIVKLGTILFNVKGVGAGNIFISNVKIFNSFEGLQDYSSDVFTHVGIKVIKWLFNIKDHKSICLDAFVFPGSGALRADILVDIQKAIDIFKKAADSCNCGFYIDVVLHSVTDMTAAQLAAVDTDGDGILDPSRDNDGDGNDDDPDGDGIPDDDERDAASGAYPPTAGCIGVYYAPLGGHLGESWNAGRNGHNSGIAMDHGADPDNLSLAHELMHQLSNGGVVDPNRTKSGEQGANTAGNIMNYNNTGENLTAKQCEEITKRLP